MINAKTLTQLHKAVLSASYSSLSVSEHSQLRMSNEDTVAVTVFLWARACGSYEAEGNSSS